MNEVLIWQVKGETLCGIDLRQMFADAALIEKEMNGDVFQTDLEALERQEIRL
jgi:hypothetical protein